MKREKKSIIFKIRWFFRNEAGWNRPDENFLEAYLTSQCPCLTPLQAKDQAFSYIRIICKKTSGLKFEFPRISCAGKAKGHGQQFTLL